MYFFFKKEKPKHITIKICYDEKLGDMAFLIIDKDLNCIGDRLSDFNYENIIRFIENFDKDYALEAGIYSYNILKKLDYMDKNNIKRVLIEKNFNSLH
jgi:hypothetical protein